MNPANRVVVGVDDYPSSMAAVDLAMREGALHQLPVHLVHADPWGNHPAWRDQHAVADDDPLSPPELAIRAALRRAGDDPTVPVTSEVVAGSPVKVLLEQAQRASMLVVGDRGAGGFAALALGSVALQLATHAPCPVLVARGQPDPQDSVVVGADGSDASASAIGFAFAEAALRGIDLVAVHAWTDPRVAGLAEIILPDHEPDELEARQQRKLTETLARWQAAFPAVKVHEHVTHGRATTVLLEQSGQAQLLVLGARGSDGFPGLRLGSVTHALLHHSRCPVAVVRPDEAARP